jgi:hypothetical protein
MHCYNGGMQGEFDDTRGKLAESLAITAELRRDNAILRERLQESLAQLEEARALLADYRARVKEDASE